MSFISVVEQIIKTEIQGLKFAFFLFFFTARCLFDECEVRKRGVQMSPAHKGKVIRRVDDY